MRTTMPAARARAGQLPRIATVMLAASKIAISAKLRILMINPPSLQYST